MNQVLSVIIPVRNEEIHLQRCLDSLKDLNCAIYVVDSSSEDRTREIIKSNNVEYVNYDAETFGEKLNWAIDNLPIHTEWTMRLDADEYPTEEFVKGIHGKLSELSSEIDGVFINRGFSFMGRRMKYGGMFPKMALRIWRTGRAYSESRLLDEQMVCQSQNIAYIDLDIVDDNLNSLSMWIAKHNNYSTREAISCEADEIEPDLFGDQPSRIRWYKSNLYEKVPLFFGALLYFIYRYIFRLGFLDGKEGLIWHVLHGFWYRFLIDAKKYEIRSSEVDYQHDFKDIYK